MVQISTASFLMFALTAVSYAAPHQPRGGAGAAGDALGDIVTSIVQGITGGIAQDDLNRGAFTQGTVAAMRTKNPAYNYVICHTSYETHFDGTEGTDWSKQHHEFDIQIGGTIGYDIFNFKSGSFVLTGDGGYLNWAYNGNVISDDKGKPRTVKFSAP